MYTYNFKNVGDTFIINVPKDLNKLDILKPERLKEQYGGSYKVYFNVQNTTAKFLTFYIKTTILCAVSPKSDFSYELPQEVFTDYMIECKTMQNDEVFIADSGTDVIVTFTEGMSLGYSNNYNNNFKNLGGINQYLLNFNYDYYVFEEDVINAFGLLGDKPKSTISIKIPKGTYINNITVRFYPILFDGFARCSMARDHRYNIPLYYYTYDNYNKYLGIDNDYNKYNIKLGYKINNNEEKYIILDTSLNGKSTIYNYKNNNDDDEYKSYYQYLINNIQTIKIKNINNFINEDYNIQFSLYGGYIQADSRALESSSPSVVANIVNTKIHMTSTAIVDLS